MVKVYRIELLEEAREKQIGWLCVITSKSFEKNFASLHRPRVRVWVYVIRQGLCYIWYMCANMRS